MPRLPILALAAALAVPLAATAAPATDAPRKHIVHKKHPASRHWRGYGFLPGYRPPEVIARERAELYFESGPHWYGPAWPGFYRGRWNGGGFGQCYRYTPIGYVGIAADECRGRTQRIVRWEMVRVLLHSTQRTVELQLPPSPTPRNFPAPRALCSRWGFIATRR